MYQVWLKLLNCDNDTSPFDSILNIQPGTTDYVCDVFLWTGRKVLIGDLCRQVSSLDTNAITVPYFIRKIFLSVYQEV